MNECHTSVIESNNDETILFDSVLLSSYSSEIIAARSDAVTVGIFSFSSLVDNHLGRQLRVGTGRSRKWRSATNTRWVNVNDLERAMVARSNGKIMEKGGSCQFGSLIVEDTRGDSHRSLVLMKLAREATPLLQLT